jgi:hypothetical protein
MDGRIENILNFKELALKLAQSLEYIAWLSVLR